MLKKVLPFIFLTYIIFVVFADDRATTWDLAPPPFWGGTLIEGMFVLYSKNDTRETVLIRNNNRVRFTRLNIGASTVDRFIEDDKRVDFQFSGKGGVITSVEMVFGNRTLEEYSKIINDTKMSYGSALSIISEHPYFSAGNEVGVIGVARAKYNVWGINGWTIEIEFISRTVPLAGENSREIKIKESKNIVIGGSPQSNSLETATKVSSNSEPRNLVNNTEQKSTAYDIGSKGPGGGFVFFVAGS